MPRIWLGFLLRLALLALAGSIIGWSYDQPLLGLLLAILVALAWQLFWLYRLDRWLRGDRMQQLPEGSGVWAQVFAKIDFNRLRARQRNKRFKTLLKQMRQATRSFPDGGIILSRGHEIVTMNRVAEELLGLKRKPDRGLRIETLIRDPDFVAYLSENHYDTAVEFPSPVDSAGWLACHQVPYGLDQKLLLIRDITTQRNSDDMRRDFVANASHELRTPLTVITGYLDAFVDDEALGDDLKLAVGEMQQQAQRMRNLVEELLHLSELESKGAAPDGDPVNIGALMETARQEVRVLPGCPENIDVRLDSEADLCGDQQDIQSIVSNLVSNAVRYTPVDGEIVVRWTTDDSGGYLSVTDTGAGIANEHIPRLTERFYRVENGRERIGGEGGTGLGLAIVKHALIRHSAALDIYSDPGAGSVFSCHFPAERIVARA
jgi:two-component system phosphate regulon sensor histidine kinase PhoR